MSTFFTICHDFFIIFLAFYEAYRPSPNRVAETDPSRCRPSRRPRPRLLTMFRFERGLNQWIEAWAQLKFRVDSNTDSGSFSRCTFSPSPGSDSGSDFSLGLASLDLCSGITGFRPILIPFNFVVKLCVSSWRTLISIKAWFLRSSSLKLCKSSRMALIFIINPAARTQTSLYEQASALWIAKSCLLRIQCFVIMTRVELRTAEGKAKKPQLACKRAWNSKHVNCADGSDLLAEAGSGFVDGVQIWGGSETNLEMMEAADGSVEGQREMSKAEWWIAGFRNGSRENFQIIVL